MGAPATVAPFAFLNDAPEDKPMPEVRREPFDGPYLSHPCGPAQIVRVLMVLLIEVWKSGVISCTLAVVYEIIIELPLDSNWYDVPLVFALFPGAFMLEIVISTLVVVAFKFILNGRIEPGAHAFAGAWYYRRLAIENLVALWDDYVGVYLSGCVLRGRACLSA